MHHLLLELEDFGARGAAALHSWIATPLMALFSTWALVRLFQWRRHLREDLSRVAAMAARRKGDGVER